MSEAATLIARLEALLDAIPNEPTLEAVALYVEARAPIAVQLAALEPESMSASERLALGPRLERVLERDRPLLTALFERHLQIGEQLRGISRARTAARGYGGRAESSRLLRKTA